MKGTKRALQAILIAGKDQRDAVLNGNQKITIRYGIRDYTAGPVLIGCHILNWATLKNITDVRHTTVIGLKENEIKDCNYSSKEELLEELVKFYPEIKIESKVTVIRWE